MDKDTLKNENLTEFVSDRFKSNCHYGAVGEGLTLFVQLLFLVQRNNLRPKRLLTINY
jgi:hypothetical protein